MDLRELSFNRLNHNSYREEYNILKNIYSKLFFNDELKEEERSRILAVIVLFSNQSDELLKLFAYRMALAYGTKTNDYSALYDISINTGLIPIAYLLKRIDTASSDDTDQGSFLSDIVNSYIDNFRVNNIVRTEQQLILSLFFSSNINNSTRIIAPTSYGKSELIISTIESCPQSKICIIVPSKALLSQTRKRILDADIDSVGRIVSHPEMHRDDDDSSVYVLTQERVTRLLNQNRELYFDIVIIDEAHNILHKDSRNTLLASVVKILEYRNQTTAFKFLTPFLNDPRSLDFRISQGEIADFKVSEHVKSERLYIADYRKSPTDSVFYDQYTDEYIGFINDYNSPVDYLIECSLNKNIVYFNRPKHIQIFSKELADSLPPLDTPEINEAINEIANNTHNQYMLLHCLRHGVLYHHGSMTDAIRNYVEHIFREFDDVHYLVSSSTLLEGVNLPIERMFLFDIKKGRSHLRPSQFKNLIGRVNRFNDIFESPSIESLGRLEPEIHIIGNNEFLQDNVNLRNFISKVMKVSRKEKDNIENVLLEGTVINDKNQDEYDYILTRLENMEEGITDIPDLPIVTTEIGMKLIESNINEIDILRHESSIQETAEYFKENINQISDSNTLMQVIYDVFVAFIDEDRNNRSLIRLKSDEAQTFYAMFLDWSIENAPLGIMIGRFIAYWDGLPDETPVFIGNWGDVKKDGYHRELFTFISQKSAIEKVNLAIVRIKEEEDFLDYVIFRFIDILNDIGLIDDEYYKLAKYGSTDTNTIIMIQNGFSRRVAMLLMNNYSDFFNIQDDNIISVDPSIHDHLISDGIGYLQRQEILFNVKMPG